MADPQPQPKEKIKPDFDQAFDVLKGNIGKASSYGALYEKQTAPLYRQLDEVYSEPRPNPPELQKPHPIEELQQKITAGKESAEKWMGASALLAGLIGAFARPHSSAGMDALVGGMKGIKEGNDALTKKSIEEFKAANDSIIQSNKFLQDQYDNILKDRKGTIDDISNRIGAVAQKYQDMLMFQAAQNKDVASMAHLITEREKSATNLQDLTRTITDAAGAITDVRNTHGKPYLDLLSQTNSISPAVLSEVQAIGDYKTSPRMPRAGSKVDPQAQAIMAMVRQYNPDYDATQYQSKLAGATSGARMANSPRLVGNAISIDQAVGHVQEMNKIIPRLNAGGFVPLNRLRNMTNEQIQNSPNSEALFKFKTTAEALSNEFANVLAGAQGSALQDRDKQRKLLDEANTPQQLKTVVGEMMRLMNQRYQSLNYATNRLRSGDPNQSLVRPETTAAFSDFVETPEDMENQTPGNYDASAPEYDPLGIR